MKKEEVKVVFNVWFEPFDGFNVWYTITGEVPGTGWRGLKGEDKVNRVKSVAGFMTPYIPCEEFNQYRITFDEWRALLGDDDER